jgi:acetyl esterase
MNALPPLDDQTHNQTQVPPLAQDSADELHPPEFELTDAERAHLTLLRQPESDFLPLIGERERIDGQTLHPKAQWFLQTIARPADTPQSLDEEEALMDTAEGRAAIRRFVDRAWTIKTRLGPPLAAVEDRSIPSRGGALPLRIYTPLRRDGDALPLLVYCHGGGWLFGSIASVDRAMRILAHEAQAVVVSVEYRLAPEHPYPAAHDDAEDAYLWAVGHAADLGADASMAAVGGDSAGGHLAVATARRQLAAGRPAPRFQLLYYPVVDWARDTPSFHQFGSGYGLDARFIDVMERLVFPDPATRQGPEFSHLQAPSLRGLPATLLATAGFDILRDQGRAFARRLEDDGVAVMYVNCGSLGHGFMQRSGVYDDADRACVATAQIFGLAVRSRKAMQDAA